VVDRHVEIPHALPTVKIHGKDAVTARLSDHVGDQLGCDRLAALNGDEMDGDALMHALIGSDQDGVSLHEGKIHSHTTYQDLAIGSCIAEIGNDSGDGPRRCPLARVNHNEQLHKVVIHRWAGRLDQEDIAAADGLADLDVYLAVGKAFRLDLSQLKPEIVRDLPSQALFDVWR
jgi:hypothetical protein